MAIAIFPYQTVNNEKNFLVILSLPLFRLWICFLKILLQSA